MSLPITLWPGYIIIILMFFGGTVLTYPIDDQRGSIVMFSIYLVTLIVFSILFYYFFNIPVEKENKEHSNYFYTRKSRIARCTFASIRF